MSPLLALDTSVAVPLLAARHDDHARVTAWIGDQRCTLTGHSLAETYAVLTRLPAGQRLTAADAATLLAQFPAPLLLGEQRAARVPALLAAAGVSGGAVYDGLVALAALDHDAVLATRDIRARNTYQALGARITVIR